MRTLAERSIRNAIECIVEIRIAVPAVARGPFAQWAVIPLAKLAGRSYGERNHEYILWIRAGAEDMGDMSFYSFAFSCSGSSNNPNLLSGILRGRHLSQFRSSALRRSNRHDVYPYRIFAENST